MDTILRAGLEKIRTTLDACDRLMRSVGELAAKEKDFGELGALAETFGIGKQYGWLDNSIWLSDQYTSAMLMLECARQEKNLSWYAASALLLVQDATTVISQIPWREFPFSPEGRPTVLAEATVRALLFLVAVQQPVSIERLRDLAGVFLPFEEFAKTLARSEGLNLTKRVRDSEGEWKIALFSY